MSTNLISAKVTVPGTSASRTFGEHMSDKVDVRDFGAKGDGTTDDTTSIQAAVTYACNNQKLLIFPAANAGQSYKISDQIVIPYDTHHWAIRGQGHRAVIKQMTDNKPFIHFDSLSHDTSGLTNGGFDIANFQVQWANSQGIANKHAAVIEFNDGGYADFVLENLENNNGCRCITHQFPGQTVSRPLNVWGCIFRHIYNAFSASGAAIYLRSNPTEGLPNILIQHVYSVQNAGAEELIHLAGATSVVIENVEQNFGSYTPGFVGWAGSGNISIIGWRVEVFSWLNVGDDSGYFICNGSGSQVTEYHIQNFEMRFNTINLPGGPKYLVKASGARVVLDGFFDPGGTMTAGNFNLFNLSGTDDIIEVGLSRIINTLIRFVNPSDGFFENISFTGGSHMMRFYKGSLTGTMTDVVNDAPSVIKSQSIVQSGWIWGLNVLLDAAVTAGTITFKVFKNGTLIDSNFNLALTSGTTGKRYNEWLKNANHTGFRVVAGDKIDVRITAASLVGPANAEMVLAIALI